MRLARTNIENLPYFACMAKYDGADTFMYLDPPYFDCEGDYGAGIFSKEDFVRLRDIMSGLKAKFMMSINDVPQIREIFGCFRIEEVTTTYSVGDTQKAVPELLITNYDPVEKVASWADYLDE